MIRTSDRGWLSRLAEAYRARRAVLLVDDAAVGIDPSTQSLLEMGRRAGLGIAEWSAVAVSLGVTGVGVSMVVMAILDPEPTSKLGLLVGGGLVCVLTGGLSAVRVLTKHQPPSIRLSPRGLEIEWP